MANNETTEAAALEAIQRRNGCDQDDKPSDWGVPCCKCCACQRELTSVAKDMDNTAVETKHYSDGTSATGVAPLPDLSSGQQDAKTTLRPVARDGDVVYATIAVIKRGSTE